MFLRKGALKICSKFTGEHPCRSVISIKLQSNFIKIALWHGCSPANLLHVFRTPFPRNTSGWLLLKYCQGTFIILIFVKNWQRRIILNFIMKMYVSRIFDTQININCKKYILAVIMIISQFTTISLPKNFQTALAYGFTLLLHCFYVNTLDLALINVWTVWCVSLGSQFLFDWGLNIIPCCDFGLIERSV